MLWIIGLVFILAAAGLLIAAGVQKKRFTLLASTETSTAADLSSMAGAVAEEIGAGSFHQIAEVAGTSRCSDPLVSELTGTPCVYYDMRVVREYQETYWDTDGNQNRVQRSRRGSDTVAQNNRSCLFEVEDATGRVTVDPSEAKVVAEKACDRFEPGEPRGPTLSLGRWRFDLGGLAVVGGRRTVGYRYQEKIVPVDRRIYVLGEASDRSGHVVIGKPTAKGAPFLVSTKSEEALIKSARTAARWLVVGTAVAALAGAVMVVLGVLG